MLFSKLIEHYKSLIIKAVELTKKIALHSDNGAITMILSYKWLGEDDSDN